VRLHIWRLAAVLKGPEGFSLCQTGRRCGIDNPSVLGRDGNWSLAIVVVIIDIRAGFGFAVAIKRGEECGDGGATF
jgi:hypothetical protein